MSPKTSAKEIHLLEIIIAIIRRIGGVKKK